MIDFGRNSGVFRLDWCENVVRLVGIWWSKLRFLNFGYLLLVNLWSKMVTFWSLFGQKLGKMVNFWSKIILDIFYSKFGIFDFWARFEEWISNSGQKPIFFRAKNGFVQAFGLRQKSANPVFMRVSGVWISKFGQKPIFFFIFKYI